MVLNYEESTRTSWWWRKCYFTNISFHCVSWLCLLCTYWRRYIIGQPLFKNLTFQRVEKTFVHRYFCYPATSLKWIHCLFKFYTYKAVNQFAGCEGGDWVAILYSNELSNTVNYVKMSYNKNFTIIHECVKWAPRDYHKTQRNQKDIQSFQIVSLHLSLF